jgi:probable aminopeptidase NPEPL1
VAVVALLDDLAHAMGTVGAIGRAFPLYSAKKKTGDAPKQMTAPDAAAPVQPQGGAEDEKGTPVRVSLVSAAGGAEASYSECAAVAMGVRRAARLVDMPPAELTTTVLVLEARNAAGRLEAMGKSVSMKVITGKELLASGHGLLHAVGRCAAHQA